MRGEYKFMQEVDIFTNCSLYVPKENNCGRGDLANKWGEHLWMTIWVTIVAIFVLYPLVLLFT